MQCVRFLIGPRYLSLFTKAGEENRLVKILHTTYPVDDYTNVTSKIISYVGKKLHNTEFHPLSLTKQKIVLYFYARFKSRGNPLFSVYDDLNPVVTVHDNFDSLLIPKNHISRNRSECYYINRKQLLRAHTTVHQSYLIKMGLDNFIVFGDVYRRDEIDSTHFPVFHQSDAVKLYDKIQLETLIGNKVEILENQGKEESVEKQAEHTLEATKVVENQLKSTLVELIKALFGPDVSCRWINVYFPFTHPSWELEIEWNGKWIEVLGCGIMRHAILRNAGVENKIGWAFGIGLERIAMLLYEIPDIRLFWTNDSGFLNQFKDKSSQDVFKYKPISVYPQCPNDISFWLPDNDTFVPNDFFEMIREIGGDLVEQVNLIDDFTHPKTSKRSLCYRIVYRHLKRTLTQIEVNEVHKLIGEQATKQFGITIR